MKVEKIPLRGQLIYASGMLGWSVLTSAVAVMLVYFYQAPSDSGLENLIPKIGVLGIVNSMSLIMVGTRIWDAFIDPVIAYFSDKSRSKFGRRIIFMRYALIPIVIFGFLLFLPANETESSANIWRLAFIQLLFNFFISLYIIPYNALLPELGHTSKEKLRISTYQQMGFIGGWIIAATGLTIFAFNKNNLQLEPLKAFQYAIWTIFFIGYIFLAIPAFFLNEKKYCVSSRSDESFMKNLVPVLKNKNLFLYIVSDFTYFIALTIMGTGALYFVTELLKLNESYGNIMIIIMVGLSVLLYPVVNWLAGKFTKKVLVLSSLLFLAVIFLYVFYMGNLNLKNESEAYLISVLMAWPLAFLGILPPVILAEITHLDAYRTKKNKEATYFAIRSLFIQFGQTLGLAVFTILIGIDAASETGRWLIKVFPNIPFNELGIRLSGIFGFGLCLAAAFIFSFFNQKKLSEGLAEMELDPENYYEEEVKVTSKKMKKPKKLK